MQLGEEVSDGAVMFVSQRQFASTATASDLPTADDQETTPPEDQSLADSEQDTDEQDTDSEEKLTEQFELLNHRFQKFIDQFDQMEFTFAETSQTLEDIRKDVEALSEQVQSTSLTYVTEDVPRASEEPDGDGVEDGEVRTGVETAELSKLFAEMETIRAEIAQATERDIRIESLLSEIRNLCDVSSPESVDGQNPDQNQGILEALDAIGTKNGEFNTDLSNQVAANTLEIQSLNSSLQDALTGMQPPPDGGGDGVVEKIDARLLKTEEFVANAIDTLARRPDPVLDLTAQRRSFATFNAAAGTFLRRLECLVASMASEYVKIDQKLKDNSVATAPQDGADLNHVVNRLADANAILVNASCDQSSRFSEQQEELFRDLRFAMSELLAEVGQASKISNSG